MSRPQFSDDNPKENPWTEDRLGFTPFAKRLADSILEVDAPNGYVIGLQGAWGSGKSTALNFVQAIIKKHNDEIEEGKKPIHVIDFRPWIVSGHQDLIESFFKIVTEQLADQKDAWSKRRKAGLRALRKNVDPVVDAAAAIGSILAPGAGTLAGIGIKLASEAAKKGGASKIDEWLAEPSLQSAYEKLRERIIDQDEKILVIIDDLDRLNREEIRAIMQMVKTLGRLPNVVYLLAYDKNIVWPALDDIKPRSEGEPSFAEKIIQQEVQLPKPRKNDLLGMLDAEIGFLTAPTEQTERWLHIVMDGVQRWIKYPRDVARLSNAVKFTWPAIEGEIDPQDVLAIEGIRLFDPLIFDWIRDHRDHLFGTRDWEMLTEKSRAKVGEQFLAQIPVNRQQPIVRLLCTLIPQLSQIFDHRIFYGLSSEPHFKIVNRRGLGSEAGYDTYFSLHPSADAVSKSIIDRALSPATGREAQLAIMRKFFENPGNASRPLLGEYFQDIRYRIHEFSSAPVPASLLEALFDFGEEIHSIDRDVSAFMLSPSANASYLLTEICKVMSESEIKMILNPIFEDRSTLSFCAEFWVWRASELGLIEREGGPAEQTIGEPLLRELHAKLVKRIVRGVEDGSIYTAPYYYHIAKVWAFGGNEQQVREWISEQSLLSAHFLAKICKGILGHTVGSDPRVYSMNSPPDEKYYDAVQLRIAAEKHVDDANISRDEQARIKMLSIGLTNLLAARAASVNAILSELENSDED